MVLFAIIAPIFNIKEKESEMQVKTTVVMKSKKASCMGAFASLVVCMALLATGTTSASTVPDGETIAWFSLDADFLSIANAGGNPASIPTYIPEGGSIEFKSYIVPHPILDASGNIVRESKYVTMNKSRVYIPLSGFDLGSDVTSITVEAFIRGDGRGSGVDVAAWDEVVWLDYVANTGSQGSYPQHESHRALYFQDGDGNAGTAYFRVGSDSAGGSDYTQAWFDGMWHHVAVAINGTTVTLFKDYAAVKSFTLGTGWSGASRLHLALGSRSGKSSLDFDEIRITKGVLAPTQFLCFGAKPDRQSGDTLLYMPFDGDMASVAGGLYEDYGSVQTGTPAYDIDVWKAGVVEFGNKDVIINKKNIASLKVNGATVSTTIRNPHLTTNAFNSATIEFFAKGPDTSADVTAWNEILYFGKGYGAAAGKDRFGFLIQVSGDKKYFLRADTAAVSASTTTTFPIADGKWHHFAITVVPGETTTTFNFYIDYGEPVTCTIDGVWAGLQYGTDKKLSFGATGSVVMFDEFRISKGALPKAKFLKARNLGGFILSFR